MIRSILHTSPISNFIHEIVAKKLIIYLVYFLPCSIVYTSSRKNLVFIIKFIQMMAKASLGDKKNGYNMFNILFGSS